MRLVVLAVVLATLLPFSAQAQQRSNADVYRIGPEDILRIAVWKNEAMSGTVLVRPDGKISLPLLNELQAAGLTPRELRDVLVEKLKEFVPNPEVVVIVQEVRSHRVLITSQGTRPHLFELLKSLEKPYMWDGLFMPNGRPFPR